MALEKTGGQHPLLHKSKWLLLSLADLPKASTTPDGCNGRFRSAPSQSQRPGGPNRGKARSVEGGAMEQQELYRYYSTQRPVDIGTYPKDPDNPLTGFLNYDERTSVEHGTFRAWGEVIYRSPLTPDQMYQYELRPSRDNPDVRRTMAEQAQVVGTWEMRNHVPEGRRMTRYVHPGKFVAGKRVTPEELARQYRLAQDYPFVYTRGPRPKKSPQIEGR